MLCQEADLGINQKDVTYCKVSDRVCDCASWELNNYSAVMSPFYLWNGDPTSLLLSKMGVTEIKHVSSFLSYE